MSIYSCEGSTRPSTTHQAVKQTTHDFLMLLSIFEVTNDSLLPTSLQTNGINWNSKNDTQFLICSGEANDSNN